MEKVIGLLVLSDDETGYYTLLSEAAATTDTICIQIKRAADFDRVDAVMIMSGMDVESMTAHTRARGLMVPLREFCMSGLPVHPDDGAVAREFIHRNNLTIIQTMSLDPPVLLVKLASLVRCDILDAHEVCCRAQQASDHVLIHTIFNNAIRETLQQTVFVFGCVEDARRAMDSDWLLELRSHGHGMMKRASLANILELHASVPCARLLEDNDCRASCFCEKRHTASVLSEGKLDFLRGTRIVATRVDRVVIQTTVVVAPGEDDMATKRCIHEAHSHLMRILQYRSNSSSWHPHVDGLFKSLFDTQQLSTSSYCIRGEPPLQRNTDIHARLARAMEQLLRVEKRCAHCGKTRGLSFCQRCKAVHYCNRECQRAHWPVHKPVCNM